jgi:hypothetical protein
VHDRLLDPTTPRLARADKGERANVAEGRLFADFPDNCARRASNGEAPEVAIQLVKA